MAHFRTMYFITGFSGALMCKLPFNVATGKSGAHFNYLIYIVTVGKLNLK